MEDNEDNSRLFHGWENYPVGLSTSAVDFNAERCHETLERDSERLFMPSDNDCELHCSVVRSNHDGTEYAEAASIIKSSGGLEDMLQNQGQIQVFEIVQEYSWGRLLVTEELFRKVVTSCRINPSFLSVVHGFGERISYVEESFSACYVNYSASLSGIGDYDLSYNLKYIATHDRSALTDPFSVRQVGVHHKYDSELQSTTWIIIRLRDGPFHRTQAAIMAGGTEGAIDQLQNHIRIIQDFSEEWRMYANHLENSFSEVMDRGFLSHPNGARREGAINAEFSDVRKVQLMIDKLERLIHLVGSNIKICHRLQHFSGDMQSRSPEHNSKFYRFQGGILNCMSQLELHQSRFRLLVGRTQVVQAMVRQILDLRSVEIDRQMNVSMHELSKRSAEESKMVHLLTQQATEDTRSMKVVALVTAIFLPANFVATFFGTNFFGFEEGSNGYALTVASNVWIYVLAAVAFSAVAVGVWFWWYHSNRNGTRMKADLEAKP